ncbi:transposase, partial [Candidatus Magnetomorum sp. HK-1]
MKNKLEIIELDHEKLESLVKRVEKLLPEEDAKNIKGMIETLKFISEKLKKKNYQIKRILKQIFGIKSEKSDKLFGDKDDSDEKDNHEKDDNITSNPHPDVSEEEKEINTSTDHEEGYEEEQEESDSKKGHGRNGVESYTGAEIIPVAHTIYKNGDNCPDCLKGKLYKQIKPGIFIMVAGSPPIDAKIYELEKLRCNLCGKIFQADSPDLDKNIVDNP